MAELVVAAGLGLTLGACNHALVAQPLARLAHVEVGSEEARRVVRQVYGRFVLRMLLSLAGLGLAYLLWREGTVVATTLGALLVANGISVWQNRRRYGPREGGSEA